MNLSKFLFGGDDKIKKKSNFNPQQQQFFQQFLGQLMNLQGQGGQGGQGGGLENAFNLLQQYMDPNSQGYKDFEAPYLNEFNEQTLPGIAERFAGGAQGGALSSSGFGQALGGAASQYKSNLTGMKQNLQKSNLMDFINTYLNQTSQALGASPFMYANRPGNAGVIPGALSGFAGGLGRGFGGGF